MTSNNRILALFPGQGSQKVGMGREFFDQLPFARELFEMAGDALGFSLSEICFEGPLERLTATEIVQPAILTVSTICFQAAKQLLGDALQPAAAAGHSLGEYSALVAAGALDFCDAVRLVHKRGRYMQAAVPAGEGKMMAVLGKDPAELEETIAKIAGTVQIANINAPGQIVVSGAAAAVDALKSQLPGTKMIELTVSAPFHCALMEPAQRSLRPGRRGGA
jgi:[acyl-carrier-protein] S-malonyltransferase